MAKNSIQGKREAANPEEKEKEEEEEEEDEEEALSLCDLPDNLIKEEDRARKPDSLSHQPIKTQEEFDFLSSWSGGSFCIESEMCVADEVFFQGQILPLRKSFSSHTPDSTPTGFDRFKSSRSGSMGQGSMSQLRSYSCRSSSIRSQNSSSSTSSTSITTTPEISKPRVRNQFHTHPSPKPQIKIASSRQVSFGNLGRKSKSSTWDLFRLGVVPAPEIALQDLKVRCTNNANKNSISVSRNSSSSSSSNSTIVANSISKGGKMGTITDKSNHSHSLKQLVGKGGGFLSGCKCSIETVSSDVMIKSGTKSANKTESRTHAMKEKVKQKQRKKAMSRRRTFEWVKELSHASYGYPDEEALLSNS